jgi:hypothetical protein
MPAVIAAKLLGHGGDRIAGRGGGAVQRHEVLVDAGGGEARDQVVVEAGGVGLDADVLDGRHGARQRGVARQVLVERDLAAREDDPGDARGQARIGQEPVGLFERDAAEPAAQAVLDVAEPTRQVAAEAERDQELAPRAQRVGARARPQHPQAVSSSHGSRSG